MFRLHLLLPARTLRRAILPLSAAASILASCGGGGGGGGPAASGPSAPSTPPPPPPPCVQTHDRGCVSESDYEALAAEAAVAFTDTASFENQWGLEAVGADRAYANLQLRFGPDAKPGEGVTVGVLDTGIDSSHPAFEGKSVFGRLLKNARDEDGSDFSHGTAVASVIAGVESPDLRTDASGVAWGADLAVFAIPLGSSDGTYRPIAVESLRSNADYFAEVFTEILDWRGGPGRIDFLNLSFGIQGVIDNYSEGVLREPMKPLVEAIAQADSEDKTVFVWAAGNSHGDECDPALPECVDGKVEAKSVSLLPGLAARFPELKPHTLAVVAIKEDGEITDFSNRCGLAEDYCLAAPGEDVTGAYFGPYQGRDGVRGTVGVRGTSFAAPMVTGGLALMKQFFRDQLPNTNLVARLLETADRSGVWADSADLRPRAPGPRRRHLAGGRTGGRGRFACRWPRSRAATDEPAARRRLRQRSGLIARKSRSRGVRRPGRALLVQFQRPFDAGTGAPPVGAAPGNFNGYPLPVRPTRRRTTSACPCWRPPPRPAAHCRRSI